MHERLKEEVKEHNEQETQAQKTIVSFSNNDPEDPYNWSAGRKIFILIAGIVAVTNSTLGSSFPSGAINYISKDFHVTNEQQLVLPISLFLVGYVLGPVFFGPLSETYGRKIIMIWSFVVLTLFTMACALAPNWPAFLIFRLICGINASSAIAVVGGLYADVFRDPVIRGRAMAIFMAVSGFDDWPSKCKADHCSVYGSRPSIGPNYLRLCIRGQLALDFLGRLDHRRSLTHRPALSPRNVRTYDSQGTSQTHAQRNRKSQYLRTH